MPLDPRDSELSRYLPFLISFLMLPTALSALYQGWLGWHASLSLAVIGQIIGIRKEMQLYWCSRRHRNFKTSRTIITKLVDAIVADPRVSLK
jgi:hypothetical protein